MKYPWLRLDNIYEDPLILDVMSGGMGGPPVTVELLLGETPLKELLASGKGLELLAEGKIRDRTCDRVQVKLEEGPLVFWIDRQSHLLLRLEYPADRLAREMAAGNCTDVSLTAEFVQARVRRAGHGRQIRLCGSGVGQDRQSLCAAAAAAAFRTARATARRFPLHRLAWRAVNSRLAVGKNRRPSLVQRPSGFTDGHGRPRTDSQDPARSRRRRRVTPCVRNRAA